MGGWEWEGGGASCWQHSQGNRTAALRQQPAAAPAQVLAGCSTYLQQVALRLQCASAPEVPLLPVGAQPYGCLRVRQRCIHQAQLQARGCSVAVHGRRVLPPRARLQRRAVQLYSLLILRCLEGSVACAHGWRRVRGCTMVATALVGAQQSPAKRKLHRAQPHMNSNLSTLALLFEGSS